MSLIIHHLTINIGDLTEFHDGEEVEVQETNAPLTSTFDADDTAILFTRKGFQTYVQKNYETVQMKEDGKSI